VGAATLTSPVSAAAHGTAPSPAAHPAQVTPTPTPPTPATPTPPTPPAPTPTPTPTSTPLRPGVDPTSLIARVVKPTPAFARPRAGGVRRWLSTQASWGGGPVGLMVTESYLETNRQQWLRVQLPGRPNGHSAWVRRSQVATLRTAWSIEVRLRTRTVTLRRSGHVYRRWRAVIGAVLTPTPTGVFAVSERNRQPDANGFYGPWILRLTARSDALKYFDGGPGTVGLHGRGGASLLDPLGSARSHGCVRLENHAIATLARLARPGTPVLIRR
jgi:lipoprotein-anchoring transpeptidase ErfK/SrfK